MNFKFTLLVSIILIASSGQLFSQKEIDIKKTNTPPFIDGLVNDKCWDSSLVIDEFYQREPNEGKPMTDKTEVFICYDANYLYFGIKCYEDHNVISAKEMLRDASQRNDDRVAIMLDTYYDHRNAFFFGINALGGIEDALVSQNGGVWNGSWNGLFVAKSKITDIGWEAEVVIPFKSVGFDKKSDHWGLFMNRFVTKKREWGSWPVGNINSDEMQISDGGIMSGLKGITQGIGLDVAPYLLSGFDSKRDSKTKYKLNGGTDIFYQITPSLKSSLSINTDFAETEADSRQINLTRFNILLNEKRNFFLDGSNYFNFGINNRNAPTSGILTPFFSRTVGLDERGSPIPVNYVVKLTGSINNWNLGVMNISDQRDYGNSNFSVARVTHNLGQLSSIGMITTFGNSNSKTQNILTGLDLRLASSKFMGNKNISLALYGIKSTTENIHGRDASWGGAFSYPNDLINFNLGHVEIGQNFVAGLGYVPRTNIKESYGSLTLGPRLNKWGIRQITFGGDFDYVTDFANKLQSKQMSIKPLGILFESGETFNYSLVRKYDFLVNDFNIYSNFIIPTNKYRWWENQFSFATLGSRKVYGSISYGFGNFYTGQKNTAGISTNWKVAVRLFIGGNYSTNIVKLPEGQFTANIYQFKANILFSPSLTLYNLVQYDTQSKIIGWQSRFKWILKPGNEILLVWNSGFTKPLDRYVMNESALRFKLKYNIRF